MSFLSGIGAWILKVLLDWLKDLAFKWWTERTLRKEIERKDAVLLKEYDDAVQRGVGMSREERRAIADRLLNRDTP